MDLAYTAEIFPISLVRFLQWKPAGHRPQHGWVILAAILFASSGAVNVLLWLLTGRRFGFSDPHDSEESDSEEDHKRASYMMGMLSPGATGMHSPAVGSLHSPSVAGGGETHFARPSFPEDSIMTREAYIPEPYEWAPPQDGELGP
jgi:hypothetical protein